MEKWLTKYLQSLYDFSLLVSLRVNFFLFPKLKIDLNSKIWDKVNIKRNMIPYEVKL